jgi:Rrf2 family iron-sulfur cluster assembly transcriptional regulator
VQVLKKHYQDQGQYHNKKQAVYENNPMDQVTPRKAATMRISTKGRHAVMAMLDFARHGKDRPVPLADVAQRQMISLSYLEQLVSKLKKSGLVKSMRGPGGGYLLAYEPQNLTIQQIVNAVDVGATRERPLFEGENLTARQLTDQLWHQLATEVQRYMKSVTLADILSNKR